MAIKTKWLVSHACGHQETHDLGGKPELGRVRGTDRQLGVALVLGIDLALDDVVVRDEVAAQKAVAFGKDRQRHTAGNGYADGRAFGKGLGLDRQISGAKKPTPFFFPCCKVMSKADFKVMGRMA